MTYTFKAGTTAPAELWVNGRMIAQGTYTYCAQILESFTK